MILLNDLLRGGNRLLEGGEGTSRRVGHSLAPRERHINTKWSALLKEYFILSAFLFEYLSEWNALLEGMTHLPMLKIVHQVLLVFMRREVMYLE